MSGTWDHAAPRAEGGVGRVQADDQVAAGGRALPERAGRRGRRTPARRSVVALGRPLFRREKRLHVAWPMQRPQRRAGNAFGAACTAAGITRARWLSCRRKRHRVQAGGGGQPTRLDECMHGVQHSIGQLAGVQQEHRLSCRRCLRRASAVWHQEAAIMRRAALTSRMRMTGARMRGGGPGMPRSRRAPGAGRS